MNNGRNILLGPILGLETDTLYSVIFTCKHKYKEVILKLSCEGTGWKQNTQFSNVFQLHSTWVYKFVFSIDPNVGNMEINYEFQALGVPILDQYGNKDWTFVVPGKDKVPKIGFASCNGNVKKLPQDQPNSDYVMWDRLFQSHSTEKLTHAFHCLILGGDQIYADPIWKTIPYFKQHNLLGWRSNKAMINHKVSDANRSKLESELEAFYESLYIESWSKPSVAKVLSAIPSIMMWDDHDIFDGWGSQPPELQSCELFQLIYKVARKYFEIFQIRGGGNISRISQDHFSLQLRFRNYEIFVLDNRSYRTNYQVMSNQQYIELENYFHQDLFKNLPQNLDDEKVILFSIPVPIAHLNYKKRTEFLLRFQLKFHFKNSFNDDALDHWDHGNHVKEQKRLLDYIFGLADKKSPKYVHIISGDVHSAGAGCIEKNDADGTKIVNEFISSPIVYKPVCKIIQFLLRRFSDQSSEVYGYKVKIDKFGFGPKPAEIIYQRNFGAFYKWENKGLKAYFTFENNIEDDTPDQPSIYFRPNEVENLQIT